MGNTDAGGILLIGNPASAILGGIPADKPAIQVCGNIHDGIETARKTNFAVIAVVMKGTAANLRDGLSLLRENTNAKILLLARMHEEPEAIKLVGRNGTILWLMITLSARFKQSGFTISYVAARLWLWPEKNRPLPTLRFWQR